MGAIESEPNGTTLILRLNRPPVNALDVDTLEELSDRLDEARSSDARAVVLTGAGSLFSAGADLYRVLEGGPGYIDAGIAALTRAFETLFVFPRPVVAAVNGHALAGGCILTCACDYRIMSASAGTIGAVELKAGVPFPAWALEILRYAVNNHHVQEVVYTGRSYAPDVARDMGLVDEVVAAGDLMERALEMAAELAAVPSTTFALMKQALRKPAVEAARAGALDDDEIKAAWRSEEVHDAIRALLASLARG